MADHLLNPPISRRAIIRISGSTALAAVGLGSLGVPSSPVGAAPAGHSVGNDAAPASTSSGAEMRLVSNSADLLIRDGSPWWESPDIWTVPGADPGGSPGTPSAGDMAYVWALVRNDGDKDAVGIQVRFYWGNPSVQMFYSTLNLIGTAYADVEAGESQEVLCLVPWPGLLRSRLRAG